MNKIKTKVVHSKSKSAWNVVGISLPGKYKIACCPYLVLKHNEKITAFNKNEALEHAQFISNAFNQQSKKNENAIINE